MNSAKPLVSLLVMSYNHERFVKEAVEGALNQTFELLEIIFSDDCSTDRSYCIMHGLIQKYSGPHKVSLVKSNENLGIGAHLNKLVNLSSGDLIVLAAADDVSDPTRCEVVYRKWIEFGRPSAVISNVFAVDESGIELDKSTENSSLITNREIFEKPNKSNLISFFSQNSKFPCIGAANAFSAELFQTFGHIQESVRTEDATIWFRSLLANGRLYIPNKLLRYRVHAGSVSTLINSNNGCNVIENEDRFRMLNDFRYPTYQSYLCDLRIGQKHHLIDQYDFGEIEQLLISKIEIIHAMSKWWNSSFLMRSNLFVSVFVKFGTPRQKMWAIKRIFGVRVFAFVSQMKKRFSKTL